MLKVNVYAYDVGESGCYVGEISHQKWQYPGKQVLVT